MPWLLIAPLYGWRSVCKNQRSWWCQLCLHQLWTSHAMATQLSNLQTPGTSFLSIRLHCAPSHTNQSKGWWFLGGCSAASFIAAVWQYHHPALAFVASYAWCLSYNVGVRCGACIAIALLLLTMLVLHCSACMITTLQPFAIFCSQAFTDRVGPLAFASVLVAPNSAILE